MPSFMRGWIFGGCLLVLCGLTGCSKTEELEAAVRRAEKAEKTVLSLRQVQNELIEKKKDLELQVLQLQQPNVADVNDLRLPDVSQEISENREGQDIEEFKQQLSQARVAIAQKDKEIQELQDLVEALTHTVNELQDQYDADAMLDDGGMQDPNLLENDTQE